ncbi:MAG: hypothetical protein AB7K52_09725 [Phycisphaerales bacterium]
MAGEPAACVDTTKSVHDVRARVARVVATAIALVLLAHALAVLSPLRVNFDSVLLLEMVENHLAGRGWNPDMRSQHPVLYPMIVRALHAFGLAGPAGLVPLNVLMLAVGLWMFDRVLARAFSALPGGAPARRVILLLTALSWVVVKHAALVVTDVVFFGLAAAAILAMERAASAPWSARPAWTGRGGWLSLGAALAVACVLTRTVGIALLPGLAWAALGGAPGLSAGARFLSRRPFFGVGVLSVAAVSAGAGAWVLTRTSYWAGLRDEVQGLSLLEIAARIAGFRLSDLGQTLLNVPESVVPAPARGVLIAAGLVGAALVLVGLWNARARLAPTHVVLLAYAAILLAWPFADPRFLLPVLPILGALVVESLRPLWMIRAGAVLAWAYVIVFSALGCGALALSLRLTFAGPRFPDLYGSGVYADSYRAAMGQPHDPTRVDPLVVRLLRRFDPAHAPGGTPDTQ